MHMGISTISPLCSNLSLFVSTVVFARMSEGMLAETVDNERERVTIIQLSEVYSVTFVANLCFNTSCIFCSKFMNVWFVMQVA